MKKQFTADAGDGNTVILMNMRQIVDRFGVNERSFQRAAKRLNIERLPHMYTTFEIERIRAEIKTVGNPNMKDAKGLKKLVRKSIKANKARREAVQ